MNCKTTLFRPILIVLLMTFASIQAFSQGATCASPVVISDPLPYVANGLSTAGMGDDYTATAGSGGCNTYYLGDNDMVFEYTPGTTVTADIILLANSTWTGMYLYDNCPDAGGDCLGFAGGISAGTYNLLSQNLTAGQTYYIIVSTWGNGDADFNLSIGESISQVYNDPPACLPNSPTAEFDCNNAPMICKLNGYCGETEGGTLVNGSGNLNSVFGGGSLEKASWIRFEASSITAVFNINTYNCISGSGIQSQIFYTSDCVTFEARSLVHDPVGSGSSAQDVLVATGLTPGNVYYMLFDGYAGANCQYRISLNGGANVPVYIPDTSICPGETLVLTATEGSGNYEWATGETTASITVNPTVATDYYVADSDAGYSQYCPNKDTAKVTIKPGPGGSFDNTSASICSGGSTSFDVTFTGAGTYNFEVHLDGVLQTTVTNHASNSYTYSGITTAGTYTIENLNDVNCTGVVSNNCVVTVNSNPAGPTFNSDSVYCAGETADPIDITTTGGTVEWYSALPIGAGNIIPAASNADPYNSGATTNTTYYVVETNNGCVSAYSTINLQFTPLEDASFSYSNGSYCQTGTDPIPTITGVAGGAFTWVADNGGTLVINGATGEIDLDASTVGNTYTITYTTPGTCTGTSTTTVTITSSPAADFDYNGVTTYCLGGTDPTFNSIAGGVQGTFTFTVNSGAGGLSIDASTGTIDLSNSDAGDYNIINTVGGGATGCAVDAFTLTNIVLEDTVIVNAGLDRTMCADGSSFNQIGSLGGAFGGLAATWSATNSGGASDGTIADINVRNVDFTPGPTDISLGWVDLTLTSVAPNASCPAESDVFRLFLDPIADISAGGNDAMCSDGSNFTLTNAASNGAESSYIWTTSGDGTFASNSALQATYIPGANDILAGTVDLTITTDDPAGLCPADNDVMTLTLDPQADIDAGTDGQVCAGTGFIQLAGVVNDGFSTVTWSGGNNDPTGYDDNTALNAMYTFDAIDSAGITVTFTLTSADPAGECPAVTDDVDFTILATEDPSFTYASATYCTSAVVNPLPTYTGNAPWYVYSISPAPSNPSAFNTSSGEIDLSLIDLNTYVITLTTLGTCFDSEDFTVTIVGDPVAEFDYAAGPHCAGAGSLLPDFTPYSGSAGVFTVDNPGLVFVNTNTGEIDLVNSTAGTYVVTNTISGGASGCSTVSHDETIVLDGQLTADPGVYTDICGTGQVALATATHTGTSVLWSHDGAGTLDDPTAMNPTYSAVAGDVGNTVTFTMTVSGLCPDVSPTTTLVVNEKSDATIHYNGFMCLGTANQLPTNAGTTWNAGGLFTWTALSGGNLVIDANTGEIDLSVVGGSDPDTYDITYTISTGPCPHDTTVTVTIGNNPTAGFELVDGTSLLTANGSCQDRDGAVNVVVNLLGGGSNGDWTFVSVTAPGDSVLDIDPTNGNVDVNASNIGVYTVTNTVNATGCPVATTDFTFEVYRQPNAEITYDVNLCTSDLSALPTNTIEAGGVFTGTTGLAFNNTSTGEIDIDGSTMGAHTVTYTITTANCSDIDDENVTLGEPNGAAFSYGSASICKDNNATQLINVTMGGSSIKGTFTATPTMAGLNAVTGEVDVNACAAGTYTVVNTVPGTVICPTDVVEQFVIEIKDLPDATIEYDNSLCVGSNTASPTNAFVSGGTFSASPVGLNFVDNQTGEINLSTTTAATYTITYNLSVNGCTADPYDEVVQIVNSLQADFDYATDEYCHDDDNAVIENVVLGSLTSNGGSFTSVPVSAGIASNGDLDINNILPGTYVITHTVPAIPGCPAVTFPYTVIINEQPDATVIPDASIICRENSIIFENVDYDGLTTFAYDTNTVAAASGETGQYTSLQFDEPGSYTVDVVADNGNCTNTFSTIVQVEAPPVVYAGPDAIVCENSTFTVDATVSNNAGVNSNWFWQLLIGDADSVDIVDPTNTTSQVNGVTVGARATLEFSIDNDICGTVRDTIELGNNPSIVEANAGEDIFVCGTGAVTLDGNQPYQVGAYGWWTKLDSTSATAFLDSTEHNTIVTEFSGEGEEGFIWTVHETGCPFAKADTMFIKRENPQSVIEYNEPEDVPAKVTLQNFGTPGRYTWTLMNGETVTSDMPVLEIEEEGYYKVSLEVMSENGCTATDTVIIKVGNPMPVFMPNAFSPRNADDVNDTFGPIGDLEALKEYDFRVYNRWGEKVFESDNPFETWNGEVQGSDRKIIQGSYTYRLKFVHPGYNPLEAVKMKGSVLLLD